jgi:hypothetical protein
MTDSAVDQSQFTLVQRKRSIALEGLDLEPPPIIKPTEFQLCEQYRQSLCQGFLWRGAVACARVFLREISSC